MDTHVESSPSASTPSLPPVSIPATGGTTDTPPPAGGAGAGAGTTRTKRSKSTPSSGEIKTLFVRGLPSDIKEREVHNLFRFFTGYEGCILNDSAPKTPVAFVSFVDRECALYALSYLQNARFDLNSQQTLRINLAKSNSKIKRLSPQDLFTPERHNPIMNNLYYSPSYQYNTGPPPSSMNYSNSPNQWYRTNMNPRDSYHSYNQQGAYMNSQVPPCSTLYVKNIHPDTPERDLSRLFRTVPGFQRLKMSMKDGYPICFVEFADTQSSTNALNTFQSFMVGHQPIRIEYARAKMAKRRTDDAPSSFFQPRSKTTEDLEGADNQ